MTATAWGEHDDPPSNSEPWINHHDDDPGEAIDAWLDEALEQTFPASDPVASPPASILAKDRERDRTKAPSGAS